MNLPVASIHDTRKATRKMRWWYESLADYMLANPASTQNEIAAHFGRAASTISLIVNTDAFKAYMRGRRNEHEARLDANIRDKLFKVADKSLDVLFEKIDKKRDTLPIGELNKASEMVFKALGYTATNSGSPPSVVVNAHAPAPTAVVVPVPVDMATLEAARAALQRTQQQALEAPSVRVIDVTPEPEPEPNGGESRGAPVAQPTSEASYSPRSPSVDDLA